MSDKPLTNVCRMLSQHDQASGQIYSSRNESNHYDSMTASQS